MLDQQLVNTIPTAAKCYSLLTWLESAYDVSINTWVAIERYGSSPPVFWLYAAGGGNLFDHPYFAGRVHRIRILESMPFGFYDAFWHLLTQLESEFAALQKARTERPTL